MTTSANSSSFNSPSSPRLQVGHRPLSPLERSQVQDLVGMEGWEVYRSRLVDLLKHYQARIKAATNLEEFSRCQEALNLLDSLEAIIPGLLSTRRLPKGGIY